MGGCGVSMSDSWDYSEVLEKVKEDLDAIFRCLWLFLWVSNRVNVP